MKSELKFNTSIAVLNIVSAVCHSLITDIAMLEKQDNVAAEYPAFLESKPSKEHREKIAVALLLFLSLSKRLQKIAKRSLCSQPRSPELEEKLYKLINSQFIKYCKLYKVKRKKGTGRLRLSKQEYRTFCILFGAPPSLSLRRRVEDFISLLSELLEINKKRS